MLLLRLRKILSVLLRSLKIIASGRSLAVPSLASMTLDPDDVDVARRWLKQRDQWDDLEVVTRYEETFAKWNGSRHAFSFMSGRAALTACLAALELKPGDEVILPGYTCVVVRNAVCFAGLTPVFCDIELDTFGLDAGAFERCISSKTRAVILHHLYGLVCRDYAAVLGIARAKGIKVIEDCAHATGAVFEGRKVGNRGDLGFYSSEQSKVYSTVQGGVAVTNDAVLAEKLGSWQREQPFPQLERVEKQLRNVPLNYYQCKDPGWWWRGVVAEILWGGSRLVSTTSDEERGIQPQSCSMRMPAPIAALGLNQLQKIDAYNNLRRFQAIHWDAWCDRNGYRKPLVIADSEPVFLRYPVLMEPEKKASTGWALKGEQVVLGVWFVSSLHPSHLKIEGCPNGTVAVQRCVNFPSLTNCKKHASRLNSHADAPIAEGGSLHA